jgi:hypothetical protein
MRAAYILDDRGGQEDGMTTTPYELYYWPEIPGAASSSAS